MAYDFPASPSNGQLYPSVVAPGETQWMWSTADNKWLVVSSGTGNIGMDDLTDADTTTSPPLVGEALVWDGANWVPSEVAGGSGENVPLKGLTFFPVAPGAPSDVVLTSLNIGAQTGPYTAFDSPVDITVGGTYPVPDGARYILCSAQIGTEPSPSPGNTGSRLFVDKDVATVNAGGGTFVPGDQQNARLAFDSNNDGASGQNTFITEFDQLTETIHIRWIEGFDVAGSVFNVNLLGYYCEEAPSGAPLEGLTFVPQLGEPSRRIFAIDPVGTTSGGGTVNVTGAGNPQVSPLPPNTPVTTLVPPERATHVLLRCVYAPDSATQGQGSIYAEKDATELAVAVSEGANGGRVFADLKSTATGVTDGSFSGTFVVEFDTVTQTFEYAYDFSQTLLVGSGIIFYVEGWYIQEAGGGGAGNLPLKGLTLRPTQSEDKIIQSTPYPLGPVAAGPATYLTGSLDLSLVEGVPVEATHAIIRIEHVQTTNVEMGINIFLEKDDTTRDLASTSRRLTSTSVPNDNVVNVYEGSELVTTIVELPSKGVGTLSYKAQPLTGQSGTITGGTLRFYLEGYYIEENNSGIKQQLDGLTFTPVDDLTNPVVNQVFTPATTTSGTVPETVFGPATIDLTDGGNITVPAGATHVVLRAWLDVNTGDPVLNSEHFTTLYAEQDLGTLATIATSDLPKSKIFADPSPVESNDTASFVVPINTTANTVVYRIDVRRIPGSVGPDNIFHKIHIEGFYTPETLDLPVPLTVTDGTTSVLKTEEIVFNGGTVVGLGNGVAQVNIAGEPLEGYTFIPTYDLVTGDVNNEVDTRLFDFGSNTATAETLGPFAIDITGAGAIEVPENAVYVKIRTVLRADAAVDNKNMQYYAEKDVATINAIPQLDFVATKTLIDLSPRGNVAALGLSAEMDNSVTYVVPFDTVSNTIQHRLDLNPGALNTSAFNTCQVDTWVEGFFIQESGNIIERRILNPPLEGLTFVPVPYSLTSRIFSDSLNNGDYNVNQTIDVTNGGALVIPEDATHIWCRARLNGNFDANFGTIMYVEDTIAKLTAGNRQSRLNVDPSLTNLAGTAFEGEEITSFPVPIGANNEIFLRLEQNAAGNATGGSYQLHVLGWFIQETPPSVIGGNPLKGKTYVPVPEPHLVNASSSDTVTVTVNDELFPQPPMDLTDGGAITIPDGATHVKISALMRVTGADAGATDAAYLFTAADAGDLPGGLLSGETAKIFRDTVDATETWAEKEFVAEFDVDTSQLYWEVYFFRSLLAVTGTPVIDTFLTIQGFYVDEEAILLDAPPLEGLTYVPTFGTARDKEVWYKNFIPFYTGPAPTYEVLDGGTIPLDGSDPTYGSGTPIIDVPENAVFARLHAYIDMGADPSRPDGLNVHLQVEKDVATFGSLALNDLRDGYTRLDNLPQLSGGILQAGEASDSVTFDVEIDQVTNPGTISYRIAANDQLDNGLILIVKVLGFYIQESAKVEPVQPLEGLTFVPVDNLRQTPINGVNTGRTEIASYANPLVPVSASFATLSLPGPQGVLDLTTALDGVTTTIPTGAKYAVLDLHAEINSVNGGCDVYAYAGKDAAAMSVTNIPVPNGRYTVMELHAANQDGSNSYTDKLVASSLIVPIDDLTNTVNYRFDGKGDAAVSLISLNYQWYLQGFMLEEAAAIARTAVSIRRWSSLEIANAANTITLTPTTLEEYHSLAPTAASTVNFELPTTTSSVAGDRFVVRLLNSPGSIVNVRSGAAGPIIKVLESLSNRTKGAEFVYDGTDWVVFTAFDDEG